MNLENSVNALYFAFAAILMVWIFVKRCERNHFMYRITFSLMAFASSIIVFSALRPDALGSPFETWKRLILISAIGFYFVTDLARIIYERSSKLDRTRRMVAIKNRIQ